MLSREDAQHDRIIYGILRVPDRKRRKLSTDIEDSDKTTSAPQTISARSHVATLGETSSVTEDETIFSPHFHLLKSGGDEKIGWQEVSSTHDSDAVAASKRDVEPSDRALSPLSRCTSSSGQGDEEASKSVGEEVVHSALDWVNDEAEEEAAATDFDPFLFIKQLPKLSEIVPPFRPPLLPKKTRRSPSKTLVLDLDETLVHSTMDVGPGADFTFPVEFNNFQHTVFVRLRPYLFEFLDRASELFEVVVFTASQSVYAERLLNILDPKRCRVRHRLFRDSCVYVDGNYLKDLSILGRDLAKVVIVDNSPQAFGFQVENGIPISSWFEDKSDIALLELLPFLEALANIDDVRPAVTAKFNLQNKVDMAG